ncbi:MAG: hypothetical protein ABSG25_14650 [Bryobacteraceae bacterium]
MEPKQAGKIFLALGVLSIFNGLGRLFFFGHRLGGASDCILGAIIIFVWLLTRPQQYPWITTSKVWFILASLFAALEVVGILMIHNSNTMLDASEGWSWCAVPPVAIVVVLVMGYFERRRKRRTAPSCESKSDILS